MIDRAESISIRGQRSAVFAQPLGHELRSADRYIFSLLTGCRRRRIRGRRPRSDPRRNHRPAGRRHGARLAGGGARDARRNISRGVSRQPHAALAQRIRRPLPRVSHCRGSARRSCACWVGKSCWPYGVEQIAETCAATGATLALLPGGDQPDPELVAHSTVGSDAYQRLWNFLLHGGATNAGSRDTERSPLFLPFSDLPVGWSTIFIIDPAFSVPVILGVLAALVLSRERGLGHRLNHAGLAARRRLARPHAGHQGARRPRGRRFPAGRGDRLLHHTVAVQRGALASGRDDRRWAVSRGLLLAAGRGAAGVVREPGGRPRAARAASQRSGGGAPHVVFQRILQRPGARERRDRALRPSDGIRRAARVLVRGGPPRGGGDRTRAGPPAPGPEFPPGMWAALGERILGRSAEPACLLPC